ncbi:ATP-dependent protease ATPase subunit ClpY, putative [Plasmodium ovale]|uniref:ATP-dependent protease ATPase subunit ClpY, putative n=1 Tax=Plasmodium ovale TaxID=36330 RepID=A0A1C3KQ96_PLAOA|nr:ATP-dependent protease ATPase subunit ClpY, putative [Plasmodium ovale]
MKNLDAHKYLKLVNFLRKKKKCLPFHLKYVKNEEGCKKINSYININKGKFLSDCIKYTHDNSVNKLITNINRVNNNTVKEGKTEWCKEENSVQVNPRRTSSSNKKKCRKNVSPQNREIKENTFLIEITYKKGKGIAGTSSMQGCSKIEERSIEEGISNYVNKNGKANCKVMCLGVGGYGENTHVGTFPSTNKGVAKNADFFEKRECSMNECNKEGETERIVQFNAESDAVKNSEIDDNGADECNRTRAVNSCSVHEGGSGDASIFKKEEGQNVNRGEAQCCDEMAGDVDKSANVAKDETCSKVKITKDNIININEMKEEGKRGKKAKKVLVQDEYNVEIGESDVREETLVGGDARVATKSEGGLDNDNSSSSSSSNNSSSSSSSGAGGECGQSGQCGSDTHNGTAEEQERKTFQGKNDKGSKKCLYPHEIVEYLNKYIIGQTEAKKVVANALRQRWRRIQVNDDMKKDIIPKNILMIGPTGVGKTEIARRISMFVDAPFIKVEATKFTEVGFHGKDVDQIIKDLVEIAVKRQKTKFEIEIREQAEETVENIILYSLLGNIKEEEKNIWRKYLKDGSLDDKVISIDIPNYINNNMFSNDSVENAVKEALSNHQNIKSVKIIHQNINKQNDKKTMTIREAKQKLLQLEIDSSMNQEVILKTAINSVEEEGIVFIDEIDKICSKSNSSYNGPDASAEGVQRDLLPLIEGCVINTKYGNINTNYILFIASGAFQRVKPNDMLNELQGRLPVHVTLSSLTIKDFIEILTKTHNNLLQQNIALLKTEGINLQFTDDAIETIANAAHDMNFYVENIGVRRLHTIIEKIMEDINYDVYNYVNKTIVIDKEKVKKSLEGFIKQFDLKKYII